MSVFVVREVVIKGPGLGVSDKECQLKAKAVDEILAKLDGAKPSGPQDVSSEAPARD